MNRFLLLFFITGLFIQDKATAQQYSSPENKLYWKNRKPYSGYWQQDVAYNIDARIDETTNQINASEALTYTNNSPDTLEFVYFHLYQNAFVKGSYTHQLEKANKVKSRLGKYEAAGLGINIEDLTVENVPLKTELDNTILKVYLSKPLLPNQSVTFKMKFNTYFDMGGTRRRMQMYNAWGFMHYNGCQWFPKICVYDAKFGWETDQHLGKEFYGDFGTFNVSLDFASNYVVEATGAIQNREEVLPKELREQLDLKNFANKPWEEKPSTIIPYKKGERKKWIFYAENVHDFAFTADPSYRLGTTYWKGIECVAIAQEPHASGWQNGAELVAKTVQTFSENYGMYEYPKMVAADARDGMEYPMITMDGGRNPDYGKLLVHEIGHNWFYGMIGSNETYRASLDEGFTQFLTSEGLRNILGDTMVYEKPKSKWKQHFDEPKLTMDVNVLSRYIQEVANGNDHQLNTHSDDFNSALGHGGGYAMVYFKTATMLYNLQYTLGDSLFAKAMQHYVSQWKFAHPYFDDFRNSIIQFTHADLNWFFDEWLETTKDLNYGIQSIHTIKGTDSSAIVFKRKGAMHMPIDFTVTTRKGNKYSYYIPNTWFDKETDAVRLPRWIGWGKLDETYTAHIQAPEGIALVEIDTTHRFADRYMLDNYRTTGLFPRITSLKTKWDPGYYTGVDWKHYQLYIRPDIWYNAIDGIKLGVHWEGSYLNNYLKLDGTVWANTQLGEWNRFKTNLAKSGIQPWVNYTINFSTPLSLSNPDFGVYFNSRFLDGLWYHKIGTTWAINNKNNLDFSLHTFYRNEGYTDYLLYPKEWNSTLAHPNTALELDYTHSYNYFNGYGSLLFTAHAPFLSDSFNYNYIQLEWKNTHILGRMIIRTRLIGRYGLGNSMPSESALFLAGASPEEMMENKYVRSMGFIPNDWVGSYDPYSTGHFQYGGGLGLRGYNGYYVTDRRNNENYIAYKGQSGAAVNAEFDFTNYFRWRPAISCNWLKANVYAFADAGIIQLSRINPIDQNIKATGNISDFRMDAGIGAAFTIYKWGVFDKAKPLTLRFDMPLLLNRPTFDRPQYLGARWLIGVSRAF
ncbi:M1 family metallopeptidase [Taibaiella lutea]|uniref:M1 family metallopeptidase n=1 Tax=Taibaiella lutea TaxID=2608001 RepID=A0A5M6CHP3_9BACT|nr:M1 family metallopeptidase [Taibaiella lutea]KAA5534567.1 M1 family metallopeptidase [Taibaiella lutea]